MFKSISTKLFVSRQGVNLKHQLKRYLFGSFWQESMSEAVQNSIREKLEKNLNISFLVSI